MEGRKNRRRPTPSSDGDEPDSPWPLGHLLAGGVAALAVVGLHLTSRRAHPEGSDGPDSPDSDEISPTSLRDMGEPHASETVLDALFEVNSSQALGLPRRVVAKASSVFQSNGYTQVSQLQSHSQGWRYWNYQTHGIPSLLISGLTRYLGAESSPASELERNPHQPNPIATGPDAKKLGRSSRTPKSTSSMMEQGGLTRHKRTFSPSSSPLPLSRPTPLRISAHEPMEPTIMSPSPKSAERYSTWHRRIHSKGDLFARLANARLAPSRPSSRNDFYPSQIDEEASVSPSASTAMAPTTITAPQESMSDIPVLSPSSGVKDFSGGISTSHHRSHTQASSHHSTFDFTSLLNDRRSSASNGEAFKKKVLAHLAQVKASRIESSSEEEAKEKQDDLGEKPEIDPQQAVKLLVKMFGTLQSYHQLLSVSSVLNSDMQEKRALENIMASVHHIVRCERVTLFFVDRAEGVLRVNHSKSNSFSETMRFLPLNKGIAGLVANTGQLINIHDCYLDERFDSSVDMQTGFVTRNLLAVPVLEKKRHQIQSVELSHHGRRRESGVLVGEGGVIAVIQALNKKVGDHFTAVDEAMLRTVADLAASTINNVTMFEEACVRRKQLDALVQVIKLISKESFEGSRRVLDTLVHAASQLGEFETVAVYVTSPTDQSLSFEASNRGTKEEFLLPNLQLCSEDAFSKVARTGTIHVERFAHARKPPSKKKRRFDEPREETDETKSKEFEQQARRVEQPGGYFSTSGLDPYTGTPVRSRLLVPLKDHATICGVLAVWSPDIVTQFDCVLLESLVSIGAQSLRKARINENLRYAQKKTQALMNILRAQEESRESKADLLQLTKKLLAVAADVLQCQEVSLCFVDPAKPNVYVSLSTEDPEFHQSKLLPDAVVSHVVQNKQLINVPHLGSSPYTVDDANSTKPKTTISVLSAPVKDGHGNLLAVIQAMNKVVSQIRRGSAIVPRSTDSASRTISSSAVGNSAPDDLKSMNGNQRAHREQPQGGHSYSRSHGDLGDLDQMTFEGHPRSASNALQTELEIVQHDDDSDDKVMPLPTLSRPRAHTQPGGNSAESKGENIVSSERERSRDGEPVHSVETKRRLRRSSGSSHIQAFSNEDEELLEALCFQMGLTLRRHLTDLLLSRSKLTQDEQMGSLLQLYGVTPTRSESKRRGRRVGSLAWSATQVSSIHRGLVKLIDIGEPDFNVLDYDPDQLINVVVLIFTDLNLLDTFKIPVMLLSQFAHEVRSRYRNNPYHNFYHGMQVMWFVYYTIRHTKITQCVSKLNVLALVVGALCHDIDHSGFTNLFEVNSRSELALLYNDKSVLENHHAYVTFEILRDENFNIFSQLEHETVRLLRRMIISGILATDMANHYDLCKALDACPSLKQAERDSETGEHRQFLLNVVIHAADLSNQCLAHPTALDWATRVSEEFKLQAAQEEEEGLPATPFMQNLDDEVVRWAGQVNFIDYVALPLWKSAVILFPELKMFETKLLANRTSYKNYCQQHAASTAAASAATNTLETEKTAEPVEKTAEPDSGEAESSVEIPDPPPSVGDETS